jgi:uncharacterized LabA/DUF88 family protein
MFIHPTERVGLFIDGAHVYSECRALGFDIDFKSLLDLFREKGRLVRAVYYMAVHEGEGDRCPFQPLLDWLAYNGYSTVIRRHRGLGHSGRDEADNGLDVELAVNVMQFSGALDHIVLAAGNGAFRSLVAALQDCGKRVSVLSTLAIKPVIIDDDLRRQADHFIDLADLEMDICRVAARRSLVRDQPSS